MTLSYVQMNEVRNWSCWVPIKWAPSHRYHVCPCGQVFTSSTACTCLLSVIGKWALSPLNQGSGYSKFTLCLSIYPSIHLCSVCREPNPLLCVLSNHTTPVPYSHSPQPQYFIEIVFLSSCFTGFFLNCILLREGHECTTYCVGGSEDCLWELALLSTTVVLGIELRLSGLVASSFICWAFTLAPDLQTLLSLSDSPVSKQSWLLPGKQA